MTHKLKIWPSFFKAVAIDKTKNFEFRLCGDRVFSVGDTLILEEWHPGRLEYTGRCTARTVTYALYLDVRGEFMSHDNEVAKNIAAAVIMSI
jgi:hypothetical protein